MLREVDIPASTSVRFLYDSGSAVARGYVRDVYVQDGTTVFSGCRSGAAMTVDL